MLLFVPLAYVVEAEEVGGFFYAAEGYIVGGVAILSGAHFYLLQVAEVFILRAGAYAKTTVAKVHEHLAAL